MIFLGCEFTEGESTLDATATHIADTSRISIQSAVYNHMYVTHDTDYAYITSFNRPWNFDTVMDAKFNGGLLAGNVDYAASQVSEVRIKRREKNTYEWTTLFAVSIESPDSFQFERFDRYARSHADYEYALVPVVAGVEGPIKPSTVTSRFDGVFIMEKDVGYGSMFNVNSQFNKNHPTLVVAPIHRRFPYVFGNGNTNYYSGTLSAVFIRVDELCEFDFDNGWKYRRDLMNFLCNGQPKLLKMGDGNMWLVSIIDSPSETATLHEKIPTTAFSWVEIDDCDSGHALYENGLIDANYDVDTVV